jgi:hypothetical protein
MTTQEVANRLVELCREMKFDQAVEELYSPNIVSIEPAGSPTERCEGLEEVIAKGKQFESMTETMHSNSVSEPLVSGDFFSVTMSMNTTFKGAPGPIDMEEICVYGVNDGKIVIEQFFFTPMQG